MLFRAFGNSKSTKSLLELLRDVCCLAGAYAKSGTRMSVGAFGDSLQEYLRVSGYSQKNLAHELGLNSKVLSRKLHGSENAYLTQMEVKRIIIIWRAGT